MSGWEKRLTDWYDRQSLEVLLLVGTAPLWLIGLVLIVVAVVAG